MANQEKDFGHTKFFCTTSPKPGFPHGMRLDPAIFSDSVIKMMLKSQINFTSHEKGSLTIATFDSAERREETNLKGLDVLGEKDKKDLIDKLFQQIRGGDIVKAVVLRDRPIPKKPPFEEFINTLPVGHPIDKI